MASCQVYIIKPPVNLFMASFKQKMFSSMLTCVANMEITQRCFIVFFSHRVGGNRKRS